MPCHGYSIPARACLTGSKLGKTPGSVCAGCYALKGRYAFANVQNALERRLVALQDKQWVQAMVILLNHYEKSGFFRWHDSGDLQDVYHLGKICAVASGTPFIQHWLPTREYNIVRQYVEAGNTIPRNLNIRLSGFMVDGPAPLAIANRLKATCSVVSTNAKPDVHNCPAPTQGNQCKDCRACWSKDVSIVSYHKH
jgi:hypothetical protein